MKSLSGSATINAAFSFVPDGWRGAWGALLLYAVPLALLQNGGTAVIAGLPKAGDWLSKLSVAEFIAAPVLVIIMLAGLLVSYGALFRIALERDTPGSGIADDLGPAGLQWGATEGRLLGAAVLMGLCFAPVALTAFGLFAAPIFLAASRAPSAGAMLSSFLMTLLVMVTAAPVMIWVTTRLSPFLPATVDQRRIVLFRVWPLTRGHFWAIFLANLVIAILGGVLVTVAQMLALGLRPLLLSATGSTMISAFPLGMLQSLAAVAVLPAKVGAMTYVYRTLRPSRSVAEVFA
ncbi:MAG: hypothetical protein P4L64_18840 [Caulobacteraceae bacterium]|nr:hypothetical protein [Caulobacteraceae bacterium]